MAANSARGRTPKNDSWLESFKYRLDRNPRVKAVAGDAVLKLGQPLGFARGAGKTLLGLVETAEFLRRLSDPVDVLKSPPGQSALQQLAGGVNEGIGRIGAVVHDPQSVVRGTKAAAHRANVSLNPAATPQAPTLAGEMQRNFNIGLNQGDAAFQVGSMVVPAGAVAKAAKFSSLRNVGPAKYIAQGFDPENATKLARIYGGRGHHYFGRAGAPDEFLGLEMPEMLKNLRLPSKINESPFNILKPSGITYGDMYELHYKVDPHFGGAKLPGRGKGEGWSGKRLGLKKYGELGRVWHGAPLPLHSAVGGLLTTGNTVGHWPEDEIR